MQENNRPMSGCLKCNYALLESRLNTTTNRNISTIPTSIHKYHLFRNAQNPDAPAEDETEAVADCAGFRLIETKSDCDAPGMFTIAVACLFAWAEIVCVLPSNVICFEDPGDNDPTLMPATISPETLTPLICKFPSEVMSFGIFAETFTLSIWVAELFATEIIK